MKYKKSFWNDSDDDEPPSPPAKAAKLTHVNALSMPLASVGVAPPNTCIAEAALKMSHGHEGEEPTEGTNKKTGLPSSNVAYIRWHKKGSVWMVYRINNNGKETYVGRFKKHDEAVAKRRECGPDGKITRGDLTVVGGRIVVTKCGRSSCDRKNVPIASFAPEPCKNKDAFNTFALACDDEGGDTTTRLAILNKHRRSQCRHCRDVIHRSVHEGCDSKVAACVAMAAEIRADMVTRGCVDCETTQALQCDHKDRNDKEGNVLDYAYWSWHGGPEAMWAEYKKLCILPRCAYCHLLQPSHTAAHGVDSTTLHPGSDARRHREYTEVMTAYNNARKRRVGKCAHCPRLCLEGNEVGFQWMHKDERGKGKEVSQIVRSCVSFATGKKQIDSVIDGTDGGSGCRLGCANCHFDETQQRRKEGTELWDALTAKQHLLIC